MVEKSKDSSGILIQIVVFKSAVNWIKCLFIDMHKGILELSKQVLIMHLHIANNKAHFYMPHNLKDAHLSKHKIT